MPQPDAECEKRAETSASRLDDRVRSELRRDYFAHGGWVATRYRVGVEELIDQVEVATSVRRTRIGTVRHIEDAILATACARGDASAWLDLVQVFETPLAQAALVRVPAERAGRTARGFLDRTRRTTASSEAGRPRGLRRFDGRDPLRVWLVDRMLRTLDRRDARADGGIGEPPAPAVVVEPRGGLVFHADSRSDGTRV